MTGTSAFAPLHFVDRSKTRGLTLELPWRVIARWHLDTWYVDPILRIGAQARETLFFRWLFLTLAAEPRQRDAARPER